jgi:hypothetical protein
MLRDTHEKKPRPFESGSDGVVFAGQDVRLEKGNTHSMDGEPFRALIDSEEHPRPKISPYNMAVGAGVIVELVNELWDFDTVVKVGVIIEIDVEAGSAVLAIERGGLTVIKNDVDFRVELKILLEDGKDISQAAADSEAVSRFWIASTWSGLGSAGQVRNLSLSIVNDDRGKAAVMAANLSARALSVLVTMPLEFLCRVVSVLLGKSVATTDDTKLLMDAPWVLI